MNRFARLFYISIIIILVAASCGFPTSDPTAVAPVIQSTPVSLAKLELAVQADTSVQYTTVGQIIKFTFPVKNTGTEGIAGIVAITGVAAVCPALNTVGNVNDSLDTGETVNCTTDYPITQADLDKGSVAIAVTATINGVNSNQATATIPVGAPKSLSITVTANPTTFSQTGQKITFTYVVKNDGTTNLGPTEFTISDNLVSNTPFTCGFPETTLPPGQTVSCSAEYSITEANMAQSSISNLASASGGGSTTAQQASTTISKGDPKSSLSNGSNVQHTVIKGEWIWHIARCYGADPNKTIAANPQISIPSEIKPGIIITVPNIGSNGTVYGPPCVVTHTVASGDTWESIAKLYNADPNIMKMMKVNSLGIGNVVYVPKNSAGATSSTSSSTSTKGLSVTASTNPTTYDNVGQQITFTYVIKNTGNSNLGPDQFKIKDTLISNDAFNCGNANTTLQPNLTITCNATYAITQADMDKSTQSNNATASGGGANTSQAASITLTRGAKSLTLTTSANPSTYESTGQQIIFNYEIKNSGAASIGPDQFTVTDTLISPNAFNCGAADTTLAPNATVTCSANYTIVDANMGQSSISNYATASGGGAGPSQAASTTVNKAASGLSLTVSVNPQTYNQAGQIITFNYEIKNNGTVSLGPSQFTIKDDLIGPTEFNCGEPNTTLAPNATVACTKKYEVTAGEMQETQFSNYAVALGGGAPASPAASVTVTKQ